MTKVRWENSSMVYCVLSQFREIFCGFAFDKSKNNCSHIIELHGIICK